MSNASVSEPYFLRVSPAGTASLMIRNPETRHDIHIRSFVNLAIAKNRVRKNIAGFVGFRLSEVTGDLFVQVGNTK